VAAATCRNRCEKSQKERWVGNWWATCDFLLDQSIMSISLGQNPKNADRFQEVPLNPKSGFF
jgi:hypothetical protein